MTSSPQKQGSEALRSLVNALDELHRAAGRPSARTVSALITEDDSQPTTVSHEGVRTTLKGLRVPRWETVRSIASVLALQCSPPRDPSTEVARLLSLWRTIREGESGALKSGRELTLSEGWGGENGEWTPEQVAGIMINPHSAIRIDPSLTLPHEPLLTEEEWVQVNVRMIETNGAEFFLRALLRTLKGDYVGAESGAPYGYRDPDYEAVEAYEAFQYGCEQILRRLRAEPNLLQRSIAAMRTDETMDREDRAEMLRHESDPALMREVMTVTPETWHEVSEEAHHMVFGYLIKEGRTVGRPGLPPGQRFLLTWRIPEPIEG
ncbi:hypothetical protein I3J09_21325 [Streptomyces clavuligerus]|uniref:Uncharacterized protein n=1 Tax=Streptomyces clavuligerus TaxID=1901 RepID=B5GV31_STRCL|nr:hypothetical protein [Streptomyces clavuligerus]ANW22037.1 hypothetical protein BB341_21040 [Streptomyces clavuligerus]AXU16660.1 hypothetical protein D1794_21895 [Streptomyces clavuligerus]EDY50177.1 conserved hypothetical protein [Streptomyces clavuligerus]EFG06499.1 Hypothetical protein SCLAV_1420 [Streptomyces clavuligerus]MBY6305207.1 hypothetical protein [Streptomyces clavuligerus]